MLCPHQLESTETVRSVNVANYSDDNHGRRFNDGDSLDDLFLVNFYTVQKKYKKKSYRFQINSLFVSKSKLLCIYWIYSQFNFETYLNQAYRLLWQCGSYQPCSLGKLLGELASWRHPLGKPWPSHDGVRLASWDRIPWSHDGVH